jgi:CHASE3 domain sensor protein
MRNITIRGRIILLIGISVLFFALIGGAFLYQMLELKAFSSTRTQDAMLKLSTELKDNMDTLGRLVADLKREGQA